MPVMAERFSVLDHNIGKEHTRQLHVYRVAHGELNVLHVRGQTASGQDLSHQRLCIHFDDIDNLIEALEYIKAGPIGRMALDAEKHEVTTGVE